MIVFDASTLILLAKTELLETFLSDYRGAAVIPPAVRMEVVPEAPRQDAALIRRLIGEGRIKVHRVRGKARVLRLMADFGLERGESEALVLALERRARLVATDDRNAILASRILGLGSVTALAVLVRAHQKGRVSDEQAAFRLRDLARYGRYRREIIEDAARQMGSGG